MLEASDDQLMEEGEHGLEEHKYRILNETKNLSSFVVIGQTLHKLYYEDKLMKTQKEFLQWTKANLGFSKSTTYEYIISYRIYSEIAEKLPPNYKPPMYQSHCQLLSKVPSKNLIEIWMDVCEKAPNGTITTAFLESYLDENDLRTTQKDKSTSRNSLSSRSSSSSGSLAAASTHSETASYGGSSSTKKRASSRGSKMANDSFISAVSANENMASNDSLNFSHDELTSSHLQLPEPDLQPPADSSSLTHTITHSQQQQQQEQEQQEQEQQSDPPFTPQHPIHEPTIFHLSKSVVTGSNFDIILQTPQDYNAWDSQRWFGRIWCNLTGIRPLTTSLTYSVPPPSGLGGGFYEGGLEHLLRIVFTKFAAKEFDEGVFMIRAEFGADWFTPILQHPYCVLRHTQAPTALLVPKPKPSLTTSTSSPARKRARRGVASSSNTSVTGTGEGEVEYEGVLPPFESFVMFYLGENVREFCHAFRTVGLVPGINSWSAVMNTYQEEEDDEDEEEDEEDGEHERVAVSTATGSFKRTSISPDLHLDCDGAAAAGGGGGGGGDEMLHSGGMVSDAASLLFILGAGGSKE